MTITPKFLSTIECKALSNGNEYSYHSLDILAMVAKIREQEAEINRLRTELATVNADLEVAQNLIDDMKADAAPATEAPAVASEPTIKAGDTVMILKGHREGETGTVTQEPDAIHSTFTIRTSDGVVGGHSFAEYERNEIELAPATETPAVGTPDLTDDEIEIAKAEMDAFYGRTDDEDYEPYHAEAVEKAHQVALNRQADEDELREYFALGGQCPVCGNPDVVCNCQ